MPREKKKSAQKAALLAAAQTLESKTQANQQQNDTASSRAEDIASAAEPVTNSRALDPAKTNGIRWITGEQVLDNGTTLYLAFEQITDQNKAYWRDYTEKSAQYSKRDYTSLLVYLGDYLSQKNWQLGSKEEFDEYLETKLYKDLEKKGILSQLTSHHKTFLDKSYDYLSKKFTAHSASGNFSFFFSFFSYQSDEQPLKEAYNKLSNKVQSTAGGAMTDLVRASKDSRYNFMVYASTKPINETIIMSHCQPTDDEKYGGDLSSYDDIILSVPFATEKESLTFSHFGLFKNVWHQPDERYKNISMIVKGFSATCAEKLKGTIGEKLYFSTAPLKSLVRILGKAIGKKNIHIISGSGAGPEDVDQYGENIAENTNGNNYQIIDTETSQPTREFPTLVISGFNLAFPEIIISAQRFKLFYDNSNAIQDTKAMLSSLRYLQAVQSPLPDGISKQICKRFPEIVAGEERLTLDKAISHYQSLGAQHEPLSASMPNTPPPRPRLGPK